MLEDLVGVDKTENEEPVTTKAVVVDSPENVVKVDNTPDTEPATKAITSDTPSPVKSEKKPIKSPSGRVKWTDDMRRMYLDDCDKLSPEEVRVKWGFSTIGTVFSTKYMCRNVLNSR